ncbi:sucrose phosphorylase [Actinoplanes sp. N902-109]|uniref:sucrose phosphorylase n=1 Tax=Actinoplanes sp. (strain N902-109) TaxID=649831 RepID=UPI0003294119|nr:sucrose phosphorylase [Actinoplanes sp. N902-109]AGL19096.1 alpha amylase catalytic region [Actinoplanes sp. N902-109]
MTDNQPQLIAYADRLAGTVPGLTALLRGPLRDAFAGVHILPFYRPFDGADAGFDPEDHSEIDARLGSWADLTDLTGTHTVMADLIVNHMSVHSPSFRDVIARGDDSPASGMFLTMDAVFPGGATEQDLAAVYRPRPGLPFTTMRLGGRQRLVWTTFTAEQVDLDIRHPATWTYLTTIIDRLTAAGVSMLRLDAVGYVGKQAGTDCFLTEAAHRFVQRLRAYAHERGATVLLELHGHYQQQIELAATVDWVYDFALPPLVLHALHARDAEPLHRWLQARPDNMVTVLDTHDGIGIIDVGANDLRPGVPGLLTAGQIDALVESIHDNTAGASRLATGAAASNLDLYQVNSTFYDAVGGDDRKYLLARMVQLFLPGIPQIYYVGLFAGRNDLDLLGRSGVGRDVNRHRYDAGEITAELGRPVVRAQLAAVRLRRHHPAFGGTFTQHRSGTVLTLAWSAPAARIVLEVDFDGLRHRLVSERDGAETVIEDLLLLADRAEVQP